MSEVCCICCCCCCVIPLVLYFGFNSFEFVATVITGLKTILTIVFYLGFYVILAYVYYFIFTYIVSSLYEAGLEITKMNDQNKKIYKNDKVDNGAQIQSSIKRTTLLIGGNFLMLLLLAISYDYFMIWYIKYALVLYICYILGFVASFPLTADEINTGLNIVLNRNSLYNQPFFFSRTIMNTAIFFIMYCLYSYYFHQSVNVTSNEYTPISTIIDNNVNNL